MSFFTGFPGMVKDQAEEKLLDEDHSDTASSCPQSIWTRSGWPGSFVFWISQLISTFQRYVLPCLLPSWLLPIKGNSQDLEERLRPTAYLDGIRGLVALLVFVRHYSLPWQPHLDYGYNQYGSYHGVLRLPFLRVLFAGPWVPMMFVVSGYVLSMKPLKLAKNEEWQGLVRSMASSTFRRPIRLFLPPIISTCTVMLIVNLGGFRFDYGKMPGRIPDHPESLHSFGAQLGHWWHFVFYELTNAWEWHQRQDMAYGPHLWTIPVALQGTVVVSVLCLGLALTTPRLRAMLLGLGFVWTDLCGRKYMSPFIGGMLVRELDPSNRRGRDKAHTSISPARSSIAFAGLLFGLYLGSFPRFNDHGNACTSEWELLCNLTPNYRYWHSLAAFIVLLAISQDRAPQRALELGILQYLGSISFSFYIVHEPFLHVVAFYLPTFFWTWTGQESWLGYQCGFTLGMLVSLLALVWIADVFKSNVEDRCQVLAEKVEAVCFSRTK